MLVYHFGYTKKLIDYSTWSTLDVLLRKHFSRSLGSNSKHPELIDDLMSTVLINISFKEQLR